MNAFIKLLVGACSILAIGACARTNGKNAADEAMQSIEKAQKENDDAIKAAKDAAQKGEDASKLANDTYEQVLDQNSSGSQPGQILLYGALSDGEKPNEKITISQTTGKGWRGTSPELMKNALILTKLPAAPGSKPSSFKVANLGCDLAKFPEAKEMTAKETEKTETALHISADLVLICDHSLATDKSIVIRAGKLVLSGAQIQSTGITGAVLIDVNANELVLDGESKISSLSIDGSTTMFSGPQINASAKAISGEGQLTIESKGASYIEKKTESESDTETPPSTTQSQETP